jgi:cellobiose phosphorylase
MLIREEERLMLLFTPPFDKTTHNPGYVKGYLPGVRENGGQYTHAAIWAVLAFAEIGEGDYAMHLFNLLNPIYHSDTAEKVRRYQVEPYVIAADVYSIPPHIGRGGWTWYTGSSGWMYRLGVEAILGLRKVEGGLLIDPHIPTDWQEYRIEYRFGETTYSILVKNPEGVCQGVTRIAVDKRALQGAQIPLVDDGREHQVVVILGRRET